MSARGMRVASIVVLGGLLAAGVSPAAAQTDNGEWRSYGGDIANTRYSPLDQIDGGELQRPGGRLAAEHGQLRIGAGVQLPGDAADGGRRDLHHGGPATGGHRGRRGDRRTALDAPPRRGRAGRGGAAAPVGPRSRLPRQRCGRGDLLRDPGLPARRPAREDRRAPGRFRRERDHRPDAEHGSGDRPAGRRDRPARDAARGRRHDRGRGRARPRQRAALDAQHEGLHPRFRRRRPASASGSSTPSRAPTSSATTVG